MDINTAQKIRHYIDKFELFYTRIDNIQKTFSESKMARMLGYVLVLMMTLSIIGMILDRDNIKIFLLIGLPGILLFALFYFGNMYFLPFVCFICDTIKLYLPLPSDAVDECTRKSKNKSSIGILIIIIVFILLSMFTKGD